MRRIYTFYAKDVDKNPQNTLMRGKFDGQRIRLVQI